MILSYRGGRGYLEVFGISAVDRRPSKFTQKLPK
nr:MAG TPA: hypothetical protein [Caudoviricetes sp.]